MNQTQLHDESEARRIFTILTQTVPEETDDVETRIRFGVSRMLAFMWKEYWEWVFQGKRNTQVNVPDGVSPDIAVRQLWLNFAAMNRERWDGRREKLDRFGRPDDAAKEQIKIAQLDDLVRLWKRELGDAS